MPSLQKKYTLDQVPQAFAESSTGTVKGKLVIDVENSTNSVIYQQL
jgi:D-arabinose 1-dehydrogenase-like Zn-dependent alcohol dehydrogenase